MISSFFVMFISSIFMFCSVLCYSVICCSILSCAVLYFAHAIGMNKGLIIAFILFTVLSCSVVCFCVVSFNSLFCCVLGYISSPHSHLPLILGRFHSGKNHYIKFV